MDIATIKRVMDSPAAFREALCIDTPTGAKLLSEVLAPWQRADFEALDPGWIALVHGREINGAKSAAYLERPCGHSKTSDLAVMVAWALIAARRPIEGTVAAGDKAQAALLRDAVWQLILQNRWLGNLLEVYKFRIVNPRTGSSLEAISRDVRSSYGRNPDFLILDSLVQWRSRELFDSLFSGTAVNPRCMVIVASQAGRRRTWQWDLREACRQDPDWYFSRVEG